MAIFPLKRVNNEELLSEIETAVLIAEEDLKNIFNHFGLEFNETTFGVMEPLDVVEPGDVRWESLFDLNTDASHIRGRGWRTEEAVRDILQNALDANDEAGKEFDPHRDVLNVAGRTLIIDHGPGMPVKAFTYGGSKVGPCLRGGFGEGLKLAVGTMILETHEPVVFLTRDGTVMVANFFTTSGEVGRGIVIAGDRWLGIVIGKLKKRPLNALLKKLDFGTIAVLPVKPSVTARLLPHGRTLFSTRMPPTLKGEDCLKEYRIIEEENTSIYVGGLFFHSSAYDDMFRYKKSVYSYDLWANPYTGEIESSRVNYTLGGSDKMAVKFYRLWAEFFRKEPDRAVRAMSKIVRAGLKEYTTPHGKLFVLDRDKGPGELNVSTVLLDDGTKKVIAELTTRAIERATGYKRDKLALLSISPNETNRVGEVIYRTGRTPIIYNASLPTPEIEDMTSALIKSAVELARNREGLTTYDGTLAHEVIKTMAEWAGVYSNFRKKIEVHVGHCITTQTTVVCGTSEVADGRAVIKVAVLNSNGRPRGTEDIIETLLHEMAHALPLLKNGIPATVPDVSADFERALGAMATLMMLHGRDILNHTLAFNARYADLPFNVKNELENHLNIRPYLPRPTEDYPVVVGFTKKEVYSVKPFRAHIPGARLTPANLGKAMPVLIATKTSSQTIPKILELSAGLEVADATIEKAKATSLRYGNDRITAVMLRTDEGPVVRIYRNDEVTIELRGRLREIVGKLNDMLTDVYNGSITPKPKPTKTTAVMKNKKAKIDLTKWLG